MDFKARLYLATLLVVSLLPQQGSTLNAQDVAAAARANRARHESASSVKPENEWYSPTTASIHAEDQGGRVTILYEISANQT